MQVYMYPMGTIIASDTQVPVGESSRCYEIEVIGRTVQRMQSSCQPIE